LPPVRPLFHAHRAGARREADRCAWRRAGRTVRSRTRCLVGWLRERPASRPRRACAARRSRSARVGRDARPDRSTLTTGKRILVTRTIDEARIAGTLPWFAPALDLLQRLPDD